MRKILYLITELDIGGAEKSLYELVTRLDRDRFEPKVACLTGHGQIGNWLVERSINVTHIEMLGWRDLRAWKRLRHTIRVFQPNVLHTFLFHANLAGRMTAVGLRIPKIISSIRVEEPRRWHLWTERLTHRLSDVVTCVSESALRYTHHHAGVPVEKMVAIPNGVDVAHFSAAPPPTPPDWHIPADAKVVGVIGRLDRQKEPLVMMRAARRVCQISRKTIFVFAGDGPLAEACRNETHRLGLQDNIRFIGWISDTRPLLARMDLLALSSRWEGMPNAVLEAMAGAKPVIAAEVGGCSELIVDGETGYLVRPGDDQVLAKRIIDILDDPALGSRFGQAARTRARELFSLDRMVEANQKLYEA